MNHSASSDILKQASQTEPSHGKSDHVSTGQVLKVKDDNFSSYYQCWGKYLDSFKKAEQLDLLSDPKSDQHKTRSCLVGKELYQLERVQNSGLVVPGGDYTATSSCFKSDVHNNLTRVLNSNPDNLQDSYKAKIFGVDALSEETPASDVESRLHMSSVTRQDSTALDISLDDSNKGLNEHVYQEQASTQVQSARLGTTVVLQHNSQTDQQQGQLQHTSYATSPNSTKVCEDQLIWKDIEPTSREHETQDSTSLYIREGTWNQLYSSSAGSNVEQINHSVKTGSIDDASRFGKAFDKDYTSLNERECRSSCETEQKNCRTSGWIFSKRLELLLFVVATALAVLAVVVVQLLNRIQILESGYHALAKTRCRCNQENLLAKELVADDAVHMKSSLEDIYPENLLYAANLYDNVYAADDLMSQALLKNSNNKDNHKFDNRDIAETIAKSASPSVTSRNMENANSSNIKTRMDETDVTPVSVGTDIFETIDLVKLDQQETLLSRHARSSNKNTQRKDATLGVCIRKCEKNERATARGCKSHVDSFEGVFFKIFDYSRDLIATEFTTHEKWGPDIKAFRNNTILFPKRYTALPFYTETNKTASKKLKNRLVHTKDDKLGIFYIQKPGHYLININITLVDSGGTHSLALHLNGQAVLACPHGGFRCPHSNQENATKYRICNISGLLELNKNDTLAIRSMEHNMMVRLEKHRASYFNIALLK